MSHTPQVKCVVSTCSHWAGHNLCSAKTIDIWHQQKGHVSESIEETQCKSFYKREGTLGMIGSLHNVNAGAIVGSMMPTPTFSPGVHCIVSTCTYWGQSDVCHANTIEVTGGKADESEDTNCQTFRRSAEGQRGPTAPRIKPM